jgi:Ca-activated chloride channel family protein
MAAVALMAMQAAAVQAAPAEVVRMVNQANALYTGGEYEKALDAYAKASVECAECPELAYNRALVYYRMRDFTKAREMFNEALTTRDLDLEERTKFNLGNVAYSQALEKLSNINEAIGHAQTAINHYRDALDLKPDDVDARTNIEIANLLMKDLLDKQKKQQEEQQSKGDQDQGPEQSNESGESPDSGQEQQEQNQQNQDEQEKQGDQKRPDNQEGDQQQQQQEQQEQQAEASETDPNSGNKAREMTEEEAERLLQAVRDKEAQRREEMARRTRAKQAPVTRDW